MPVTPTWSATTLPGQLGTARCPHADRSGRPPVPRRLRLCHCPAGCLTSRASRGGWARRVLATLPPVVRRGDSAVLRVLRSSPPHCCDLTSTHSVVPSARPDWHHRRRRCDDPAGAYLSPALADARRGVTGRCPPECRESHLSAWVAVARVLTTGIPLTPERLRSLPRDLQARAGVMLLRRCRSFAMRLRRRPVLRWAPIRQGSTPSRSHAPW
jgi:hypothetical protein